MTTTATAEKTPDTARLDAWLDSRLDQLLPGKLAAIEGARTPSMSINSMSFAGE